MNLNVKNETDTLVSVVLGIADNLGPQPTVENCIDPKTKFHILNNTYPKEDDSVLIDITKDAHIFHLYYHLSL